ncbi:MAG: hypothetical protein ABIH68_02440 [bacterium]
MHKKKLNNIFRHYLAQRDKEIILLRKKGKLLKVIAGKFGLSVRQVSRIIRGAQTATGHQCPKMSIE